LALIPLNLPPGIYRNGTDYQSKGRWRDASLVRWYENTMRPIGGWRKRSSTAFNGKCRGLLAWRNNSNVRWIGIGTHTKLYAMSESGTLTDITPSGYTVGDPDAVLNLGYGGGGYGLFAYGTARADTGTVTPATTWSLDNWGEYLIACASKDGKIYEWDLDTNNDAVVLANAPIDNKAVLVTAERFVFALGAGGNARKVAWCDQEDNTSWTPSITNQAGDQELETNGSIIAGKRLRGVNLIFTDVDVHTAQYQGPPFVYGFERIATGCGLVSAQAVAAVESVAYWWSPSGFFTYDGFVRPIKCEVLDYLKENISQTQRSKVYAVANNQYGEIWWFYPSVNSTECDSYAVYNYRENHWTIGTMARTAGTDRGVFIYPIMVSPDGYVYEHEVGVAYDGAEPYARSGPIELGDGERLLVARQLIADEDTLGSVSLQFITKFAPNGSETTKNYTIDSIYTPVRFTGRQIEMKITGAQPATDWRVGTFRLDAVPGGMR
jgi:hypothetical protein